MKAVLAPLMLAAGMSVALGAEALPRWSAELWAMEEGEHLVAAVVAREARGEDDLPPTLAILCGRDFTLRYDPGPDSGDTDWTGNSTLVRFAIGTTVLERVMQFEALDAMFAVSLTRSDPLLAAIRAGEEAIVTGDGLPANTFSLAGASGALSEVARTCR